MEKGKFHISRTALAIGSAVAMGIGITVYFVERHKNMLKYARINDILDGKDPNATPDEQHNQQTLPDAKFPLKLGTIGKQVLKIQEKANSKWGSNLKLDGKMGEDTMKILCKNYHTSCISSIPYQWNLYSLDQNDYDTIINS